jgi:hypothetical protein
MRTKEPNLQGGPKYPNITVELVGQDGNAFAILSCMRKTMKRGGVPQEEVEKFTKEATNGDYDHLLQTCIKWVNVE